MKGLERIAENRRHKKPYLPDAAFMARLRQPSRIIQLVDVPSTPLETRYEVRRMYVVALCTAFEVYWRETMRLAIDEARLGESDLKHLTKATLSVADVAWIAGRKVTFGELIANSHTFQSPEAVIRAFSEVFQIDAAKVIAKHDTVLMCASKGQPPVKLKIPGSRALTCRPVIEECFQIRHESVHNFGRSHRLSPTRIDKFAFSIWTFCKMASFALNFEILPKMMVNIYRQHSKGGPMSDTEIKEIFGRERRKMIPTVCRGTPVAVPIKFLLGRAPRKSDIFTGEVLRPKTRRAT